mmetsp:Transcript_11359/g.36116  ORF Transcript_11359/g.36116 Transcript_11359/m.36116 type:complete len:245 (+) Transcript_11359:1286-2020(+)
MSGKCDGSCATHSSTDRSRIARTASKLFSWWASMSGIQLRSRDVLYTARAATMHRYTFRRATRLINRATKYHGLDKSFGCTAQPNSGPSSLARSCKVARRSFASATHAVSGGRWASVSSAGACSSSQSAVPPYRQFCVLGKPMCRHISSCTRRLRSSGTRRIAAAVNRLRGDAAFSSTLAKSAAKGRRDATSRATNSDAPTRISAWTLSSHRASSLCRPTIASGSKVGKRQSRHTCSTGRVGDR